MAVIDTSEKLHDFFTIPFCVQRVHLILWDFIFVVQFLMCIPHHILTFNCSSHIKLQLHNELLLHFIPSAVISPATLKNVIVQ